MNIEAMAKKAGFRLNNGSKLVNVTGTDDNLRRFAKLVAEACAKIVDGVPTTMDGNPAIKTSNGSFYKGSPMFYETRALAVEIRARGDK